MPHSSPNTPFLIPWLAHLAYVVRLNVMDDVIGQAATTLDQIFTRLSLPPHIQKLAMPPLMTLHVETDQVVSDLILMALDRWNCFTRSWDSTA